MTVRRIRERPLCVFLCAMIILIIAAYQLGITDDITQRREKLQGGEAFPLLPEEWETVALIGRIVRMSEKEGKMSLRLTQVHLLDGGQGENVHTGGGTSELTGGKYFVQVSVKGRYTEPEPGSWVEATGKLIYPSPPTCPGQYDNLLYADLNRIVFSVVNADIRRYAADITALTWTERWKQKMQSAYGRVLSAQDAGIMTSITMGDRSALDTELTRLFQDGGISHILAISGLHVNLVGMGIYQLLRRLKRGFICSAGISCFLLLTYCIMTGMSRSAVRATVMFMLWTGSQVTGRTPDTLTSLAAAACVLLLRSPASLRDGGFQMSFGCILSLCLLDPFMKELLPYRDSGRLPDRILGMFASSLAVTLGTLPISCRHYYQFSPYAPLLNIMVLPTMSALVVSGFAGACTGMMSRSAGILIAGPCHYLLQLYMQLCRFTRKLPYSLIVTGSPTFLQAAVYYILLILLVMGWKKRERLPRAGALLVLCADILLITLQTGSTIRLVFLDVGQGDCIVIQNGRTACIVDGGSSSLEEVWRYRLEPCLKYYGIRRVAGWFATHGDLDHTNGIEECVSSYSRTLIGTGTGGVTVDRFIVSAAAHDDPVLLSLCRQWEERGIETAAADPGSRMRMGPFTMRVLYPFRNDTAERSNEKSLVLLLEADAKPGLRLLDPGNREKGADNKKDSVWRVLLTGDLEREGEVRFVERWQKLGKIDVLKLGHHGSRYATSDLLLETLQPDLAIASCGLHNRYGHPSAYTLERLERAGTDVLRTDLEGSIVFIR